jgi:radical SAM superfamily enzyme YgiQ (UPF0313 family)
MFGRKMRYASPERVADELNRHRGRGDQIFFYDDNFCASPNRTKELLDHLLTHDVFLPEWLAQVSVKAARDTELLKMMQRAGCNTVFVGFESIEPGALDLYHKRQSTDDIRLAVRRFHDFGIRVHGMFMTGSDAEGVDTIRATADFAIAEDIDTIQFLVLTPLPGTPVFEDLESAGRLLTRDWSKYDTHHAVFRPARMSADQLMSETMQAMQRVYSFKRIIQKVRRRDWLSVKLYLYAHFLARNWTRERKKQEHGVRQASPSLGASRG